MNATLTALRRMEELYTEIRDLEADMREIHDRAGDTPLTEGQQQRWDNLRAGVERRRTEIAELRSGHSVTGSGLSATAGFHVMRQTDTREVFGADIGGDPSRSTDLALRAAELVNERRTATGDGLELRSDVEHLVRTSPVFADSFRAKSDPDYLTAFGKVFGYGDFSRALMSMTDAERHAFARVTAAEERAALATGSGATGGFAVPQLLDPTVVLTNNGAVNPMRLVSRVETGISNKWEGVSSAGVTAQWVAEAVESTDGSPTLAQPDIDAHKANAVVTASIELAGQLAAGTGDWARISQEVGRMFTDAKDRLECIAFATGNGSGRPLGIITALSTNTNVDVALDTAGQINAVDLRNTLKALPPRFRANAAWMMSLGTALDIQALGDDKLGNQTGSLRDDPFAWPLLNKPAYENSGFADFVAGDTGGQNILVAGDWRNYLIYDRLGATVELIPHKFSTGNNMPTGERMWYLYWRTGGGILTANAFVILQNT